MSINKIALIERIYIREAKRLLDIEDNRTFQKWCSENDVIILKDAGCRKPYVIAEQFQEAMGRTAFAYLRTLPGFQTLEKYKPSGDKEKRFLKKLDF